MNINHLELRALIETIWESPKDETPRLMLADLLEEGGESLWAEYIRLRIEVAKLPPQRPSIRCSQISVHSIQQDEPVDVFNEPFWFMRRETQRATCRCRLEELNGKSIEVGSAIDVEDERGLGGLQNWVVENLVITLPTQFLSGYARINLRAHEKSTIWYNEKPEHPLQKRNKELVNQLIKAGKWGMITIPSHDDRLPKT